MELILRAMQQARPASARLSCICVHVCVLKRKQVRVQSPREWMNYQTKRYSRRQSRRSIGDRAMDSARDSPDFDC